MQVRLAQPVRPAAGRGWGLGPRAVLPDRAGPVLTGPVLAVPRHAGPVLTGPVLAGQVAAVGLVGLGQARPGRREDTHLVEREAVRGRAGLAVHPDVATPAGDRDVLHAARPGGRRVERQPVDAVIG